MAVNVTMQGIGPVIERLDGLKKAIRVRATRRALGKAAAVVRKAARENARRVDDPETGRQIADNIGQRVRSAYARQTGNQMVSVGVLSEKGPIPKGNPDTGRRGSTPHWHLVEFGTEHAPAQEFMRPALADNINQATNAFADALGPEIDKALARSR